MTDFDVPLKPDFSAILTKQEMESGEMKHVETERLRRIAMLAGLTHSSKELEKLYETDSKAFQEALSYGIQSFDHYQSLIQLIENAILRLYSVAHNKPKWKNFEELDEKINRIISEDKHKPKH